MPSQVRARKVLVVFPIRYTLRESYNIVSKWKPDTIRWGLVNGRPNVYATKASKIQQRTKKLLNEGIKVYSGANIGRIPTLDNTPFDMSQDPVQPNIDTQDKDITQLIKKVFQETDEKKIQL